MDTILRTSATTNNDLHDNVAFNPSNSNQSHPLGQSDLHHHPPTNATTAATTTTTTPTLNTKLHNNNNNLINSYHLNHDLHQDLSIKKERGPPSLRKKQSQRFTVAHIHQAPPEVPLLPRSTDTQPTRTPSISSTSDSEYPSPPAHRLGQQQAYMSLPPPSAGVAFPGLSAQYTGSSAALSRTGTALSSVGSISAGPNSVGLASTQGTGDPDDEVIPTAIVIKNIPFSVRREQLLAIIEDLMIPPPYAFNYHFDNGVFRGLAFANFRSAAEADAAVAGLNGFDISGRKLRVEYKKVLQAGEKERIEKEKALKRMRSMQLQRELEPPPSSSTAHMGMGVSGLEEEFRQGLPASVPHRPSASVLNAANAYSPQYTSTTAYSPLQSHQAAFEGLSLSDSRPAKELDMNDPQTLELYSRVVVFKEDKLRDELAFAKALTGQQRRIVHQIAKRLGLEHRSEGVGDERFVVVAKGPKVSRGTSMARATSGQQPQYQPNPQAALLRMKKSMPDMRPRELGGFGDSANRGLAGRKSTVNLREVGPRNFLSGCGHQPDESLSSIGPGSNGNGNNSNSHFHQIIRQPKGPEMCLGRGFGKTFCSNSTVGLTGGGSSGLNNFNKAVGIKGPSGVGSFDGLMSGGGGGGVNVVGRIGEENDVESDSAS